MSAALRRILQIVVVTALLLVIVALALRGYAARRYDAAREEFEHRIGALELSQFVLGSLPEEENVATWLVSGSQALQLDADALDLTRRLARLPAKEWTGDDRQAADGVLAANSSALDLLNRSGLCSQSTYDIDYESGHDAQIPNLIDLLKAGRLVLLETKAGAATGDLDRVQRGFVVLERLATSLGRESTLITALVSLAMHHLALDAIQELLLQKELDEVRLGAIIEILEETRPINTLHRAIHAEAAWIVSLPGDAGMTEAGIEGWLEGALYRYSEDLFRAALLDEYRGLLENLHYPWAQIEMAYETGDLEPGFWSRRSPMWVEMTEGISRLKEVESSQELALAALRLRLSGLDGSYPPTHPYRTVDAYSGKPFEYELADDGSATVAAPLARELWNVRYEEQTQRRTPRFDFHLPAPDVSAAPSQSDTQSSSS